MDGRSKCKEVELRELTIKIIKDAGFGAVGITGPKPADVLDIYCNDKTTFHNQIAQLRIYPVAPHWIVYAITFDDGGMYYDEKAKLDAFDPDSIPKLFGCLAERARVKQVAERWMKCSKVVRWA